MAKVVTQGYRRRGLGVQTVNVESADLGNSAALDEFQPTPVRSFKMHGEMLQVEKYEFSMQ